MTSDGNIVDVGEAMADRTDDEGDTAPKDDVPSLAAVPKRRLWPALVVLVALVSAGGWFAYRQATAPDPLRVLIAVEIDGTWWEGSRPAAIFADEAAELLSKLGFDPVRAGDPETAEVLENAASPQEAARALGAAFVITGRLEPAVNELPIDEGFVEVAIDAQVQVEPTGEGGVLATPEIHTFSGAKDRERALEFAVQSAARHLVDHAVPAMASHRDVAALLDGQDAKVLDRLAPLRAYVAARQAALDDAKKGYAELDRARRENEQRGPLTFHSPMDADDRLVGVDGGRLLVVTADVRPILSASGLERLRSEALETLGWRPSGGEPGRVGRPLWRGYNAFTYPSLSRDGKRVALVEDLYGWAKSLVILDARQPPRRLRTESTRRLSEPRLAPDGAHVAVVDRACRRCAKELSVVDVETGEERLHVGEVEADTIDGFAWLDRARLMVVMDPKDGESGLWAIQIASGDKSSLMLDEGNATLRDPAASEDGRVVAASNPIERTIVTLDMESKQVTEHLVAGAATALSFSPDGRRLVFELQTPESLEIALLRLDDSEVSLLTSNDAADRYPLFSPDGTRVFFEARDTDPVFGKRRAVARIASVVAR